MELILTGAEKVLYTAEYNFAINVLKLSNKEADEKATSKILQKRKLAAKSTRI